MALDKFQPYLFVSAGEQSNKFLTPAYADGIAQFQAQRAQSLTGLTVRIDPIQSGTGDPAPDNIRPISGRTGMTVTACGMNVWDEQWRLGAYNGTTGEYVQNTTNLCSKNDIGVKPNTSYYFSTPKAMYMFEYAADGSFLGYTTVLNNVYTTKASTAFIRFYLLAGYGTTYANDISINYPSTDTTYHAYTGHTYPITWESIAGTVYGGTLDVVSGELTIDRIFETVDGARITYVNKEGPVWRVTPNPQLTPSGREYIDGISNIYPWATSWSGIASMEIGVAVNSSRGAQFLIRDDLLTSLADFKARFNETPLQLCYELATPQTYRLTGAEVRTITGFNQIYSDAGPVIDIKF